jgi:uncharacterized protein YkwD
MNIKNSILISLFFIYINFSLYCQEEITFTNNEYKKIIFSLKKNKEILYYCKECNQDSVKRIRIYSLKTSFINNKINLKINELSFIPQNIYIFHKNQYKNLVNLVKENPISLDLLEILPEDKIPMDLFKIKTQTNSKIPYLTQFEIELIEQINILRENPEIYKKKLEERLNYYQKDLYVVPGEIVIKTKEGSNAVLEAMEVLKKTNPLNPLVITQELCESSKFHVMDTGPKGIVSHFSSTGTSPIKRILKYGNYKNVGEVISYGFFDPEEIVIQFIIDDGILDRGHRKTLLNPNFKFIGANCGLHQSYEFMCVVDLAY